MWRRSYNKYSLPTPCKVLAPSWVELRQTGTRHASVKPMVTNISKVSSDDKEISQGPVIRLWKTFNCGVNLPSVFVLDWLRDGSTYLYSPDLEDRWGGRPARAAPVHAGVPTCIARSNGWQLAHTRFFVVFLDCCFLFYLDRLLWLRFPPSF